MSKVEFKFEVQLNVQSNDPAPDLAEQKLRALKVRHKTGAAECHVALSELNLMANSTRGYALRARPWLPYFAPAALKATETC